MLRQLKLRFFFFLAFFFVSSSFFLISSSKVIKEAKFVWDFGLSSSSSSLWLDLLEIKLEGKIWNFLFIELQGLKLSGIESNKAQKKGFLYQTSIKAQLSLPVLQRPQR